MRIFTIPCCLYALHFSVLMNLGVEDGSNRATPPRTLLAVLIVIHLPYYYLDFVLVYSRTDIILVSLHMFDATLHAMSFAG